MMVSIINTTFILITTYYLFPTEERRLRFGVAVLSFSMRWLLNQLLF